jgi:hypothetical protein
MSIAFPPNLKGRALDRAIKAEVAKLSCGDISFVSDALFEHLQEVLAITPMSVIGTSAWIDASTECSRRLLAKLQGGSRQ